MCQFGTSDESFQNHHYVAGTRVTVKLALRAGPLDQLFKLAKSICDGNSYNSGHTGRPLTIQQYGVVRNLAWELQGH
jgi:hypothetical protein